MRKFFLRGLIAILPAVVTISILWTVFAFLYDYVGIPIGEALKFGVLQFSGKTQFQLEVVWQWAWFFDMGAPMIGFIVGILLIFVAGFFMATFLGKWMMKIFEGLLKHTPVVRTIYPYARQFTDFFFSSPSDKHMEFRNAVAVPFPKEGMYSVGFVTGEGMKTLNEVTGKRLVAVFLPTSPTPFTGFVVYVPREDMIPLPITPEEAMRIIISAGVLHPEHEMEKSGQVPIPGTAKAYSLPEEFTRKLTRPREDQEEP